MSEITITRSHSLPLEAARDVAEKLAEKLRKKFNLDWSWKRNVLHFERPGVAGELNVTAHDISLQARLGLLLGFLKPRIEQEIDAEFDRYFRPAAGKKPAAKKATRADGTARRSHR